MHFHAEHPLFFDHHRAPRDVAGSIGLVAAVLVVNAGAAHAAVSLVGIGLGGLCLAVSVRAGDGRLAHATLWSITLVALALLAGLALGSGARGLLAVGSRILCGVIWVLWLGTRVDWSSLRRCLLWCRIPDEIVATLDHALLHGILTRGEWVRRRDAARLRLGRPRLPIAAWSALLGEGAFSGFERLERAEENAALRAAAPRDTCADPILDLHGVDVERGGHPILRGISASVSGGEWLAVCGPSGSGKSTLLRLIAGLEAPAAGAMRRLDAQVMAGASLRARLDGRVALLAQNPEHHFIASAVADDIAWGLRHRGVDAADARERARCMAAALGIDHLLERPCHRLSFGEQRRVALAGLLVLEPALLLLDEPTAGLDPVAADALARHVQDVVGRTGAACIWATHDLDHLPPAIGRVLLLRGQGIVFDGPAAQGLSPPWRRRAGLWVEPESDDPGRVNPPATTKDDS